MVGRQHSALQIYEKCSILSIFYHFGPFSQVFGQVKEWLILELHEIIRISNVVSVQPYLFCIVIELDREECSNLRK